MVRVIMEQCEVRIDGNNVEILDLDGRKQGKCSTQAATSGGQTAVARGGSSNFGGLAPQGGGSRNGSGEIGGNGPGDGGRGGDGAGTSSETSGGNDDVGGPGETGQSGHGGSSALDGRGGGDYRTPLSMTNEELDALQERMPASCHA